MKVWLLTKDKLKIMLLFSVGYFFYYLCRYNYPVALPFIKQEFELTSMTIGWIATALTAGYAVGQFINGFLVDRVGPRIMFTIGGIGSMFANLAMGGNSIIDLFIFIWMVNGYFQAMGYPSTLKLIVNFFGHREQGKPLGVSEFFQSLASILILPLAGFLALSFGWRFIFIVPATLLGVMTIIFALSARNYPAGAVLPRTEKKPFLRDMVQSYKKALGDWRLLSADVSYGCCQFVRYAMITWIPAYLYLQTNMGIFKATLIAMTFQIGGTIGSLIVGWLSDSKLFYRRRWLLITVGMTISGIAGACIGLVEPTAAVQIIIILMVCGAGIEALEVAYFLTPVDYLGKELTATGVGCMNAVGKAMASIQGVLLGWIIDTFSYGAAFGVAGIFGVLAAILVIPSGFRKKTNEVNA